MTFWNKRKKSSSIKIIEPSSKMKNNERENTIINNFQDFELNSFNYLEAVLFDKRTYFQYYIIFSYFFICVFAFCPSNDYNSRLIKIGIFILSFNIHYATNFVYYMNERIIHKIL